MNVKRNGSGSIDEKYDLNKLTELEMRLLYNGLKLMRGDFPGEYKGSTIWQGEVNELMKRFPKHLRW